MSRMTLTHKIILSAAAVTAAVAMALPASARCYQDSNADGAIVGAIAGAAVGNAASSRYNRGSGTVIGAIAGAALGSAIDDNSRDCRSSRDYGYRNQSYGYGYSNSYYQPAPYYRSTVYVAPRAQYYYGGDTYRHYDRRDYRDNRRGDRRGHYDRYDRGHDRYYR